MHDSLIKQHMSDIAGRGLGLNSYIGDVWSDIIEAYSWVENPHQFYMDCIEVYLELLPDIKTNVGVVNGEDMLLTPFGFIYSSDLSNPIYTSNSTWNRIIEQVIDTYSDTLDSMLDDPDISSKSLAFISYFLSESYYRSTNDNFDTLDRWWRKVIEIEGLKGYDHSRILSLKFRRYVDMPTEVLKRVKSILEWVDKEYPYSSVETGPLPHIWVNMELIKRGEQNNLKEILRIISLMQDKLNYYPYFTRLKILLCIYKIHGKNLGEGRLPSEIEVEIMKIEGLRSIYPSIVTWNGPANTHQ